MISRRWALPSGLLPEFERTRIAERVKAGLTRAKANGKRLGTVNFNRSAARWAAAHGKPMVGNGDIHRLSQLGTTYSLIESDQDPDAMCDAIRRGAVEIRTEPRSWAHCCRIAGSMLLSDRWPAARHRPAASVLGERPVR